MLNNKVKHNSEFSVLGSRWDCECGRTHSVDTRLALVEKGAVDRMAEAIRSLGLSGPVLVIADETTWDVAGRRVEGALAADGFTSRHFIVPGRRPRADDKTASLAADAVEKGDAIIVSAGSGTVTDLAKWAAFKANLPHIAVATAPSMNGYASGIVAMTCDGLKTTNAVRAPLGVIADVGILAAAPVDMIRAGIGDLISKPVSNADWRLESVVSGGYFCRRPFGLLRELEPAYLAGAGKAAGGDHEAIAVLARALILSGVSMVIAGSSAPASGGEHLISHFLDMRADVEGREHDLHGAQVGVATLATLRLYERLLKKTAGDLDGRAIAAVWERGEDVARRIRAIFGGRADAILAEFERKRGTRKECEAGAAKLVTRWGEIAGAVRPFLDGAGRIEEALRQAGAKTHYGQLGIDGGQFRDALLLALAIRSRYTVLDLAFIVGETDKWANDIDREP